MKHFKIFFFCIISNVFYTNSVAQNFVVHYHQIINLGEPEMSDYEFYFTENQSLYFNVTQKNTVTLKETQKDNFNTINIVEEQKPNTIYVDFSTKKLYQSLFLGKNNYVIEENLYHFDWNITDETKQIGDYICIKATTRFRGRYYEAWFTEEIPTQLGPWKMHSLPGLILELYDTDHLIVIQAQKITNNSLDIEQTDLINKIEKAKTINFKEYNKLLKKHIQELFNQLATKMPEGFSSSFKIDENCENCQSIEIYDEWEE